MPEFPDAACRGETDLFFGPAGEREHARDAREGEALAICAGCPAREECREWARSHREFGIWGGETDWQRAHAGYAPTTETRREVRLASAYARMREEREQEERAS